MIYTCRRYTCAGIRRVLCTIGTESLRRRYRDTCPSPAQRLRHRQAPISCTVSLSPPREKEGAAERSGLVAPNYYADAALPALPCPAAAPILSQTPPPPFSPNFKSRASRVARCCDPPGTRHPAGKWVCRYLRVPVHYHSNLCPALMSCSAFCA